MRTKDDVEIEHGMILWPEYEIDDEEGGTVVFGIRDNLSGDVLFHDDTCDLTTCYATRKR